MAEELGRGYVSDLERGRVVPTFATLAKVAELLEVEVADLVALGSSQRLELLALTRKLRPEQVAQLLDQAKEMVAMSVAPSPLASPPVAAFTLKPSGGRKKTAKKTRADGETRTPSRKRRSAPAATQTDSPKRKSTA